MIGIESLFAVRPPRFAYLSQANDRVSNSEQRTASSEQRVLITFVALLLLVVACNRKRPGITANLNVQNKVAPRTVRLFFESPDMLLVPETRNVNLPENPAGAMSVVVRELFKGPANAAVPRLFPADTVVRGAYLVGDGTAFIDLGGATLSEGWGTGSHEEMMAVYSLIQTVVANFPQAKRVRILINGEPAETLAGHIALDRSLTPMKSLLDPRIQ